MKNFSIQSKGHGDDNVMIGIISQDHLRFSCVGMMLEKHENAEVSKHCPRCECQQYDFFLYAFASHVGFLDAHIWLQILRFTVEDIS